MKKILFVAVDFSRWKYARSWSYPTYFSFSCELVKQGVNVDYFTFIVSQRDSWIEAQNKNIQRVLDNSKYDEVWCEAVHTPWTMQTLAQLYKAAPVRVAFVCESLNYPESVYLHHPELRNRKITVDERVKYFTHLLCFDERDASDYQLAGYCSTWIPCSIPSDEIKINKRRVSYHGAVYCGDLYRERKDWMNQNKLLISYLIKLNPRENCTIYPYLFEIAHASKYLLSTSGFILDSTSIDLFARWVRKKIFSMWMNNIAASKMTVNLPHLFQSFSSRIYESMAVGRPVITPFIENRPKVMSLFTENDEIMFYDSRNVESLLKKIIELRDKTDLYVRIAENAYKKIMLYHTTDLRVRQIKGWIDHSVEIRFL